MDTLKNDKGFTLVEIMIALAAMVTIFATMASAFVEIKSLNTISRHHVQAAEIVRGQIETLRGTAFTNIADGTTLVSFDAGSDGIFGDADDLSGTLTVTRGDFLDMDNDGNTAETAIDIDGDGINDSSAIPVRVTLTWTQWVVGKSKTFTVVADTLIAA